MALTTAFSPDGRKVATEVMKKIVLLDASTGKQVQVLDPSQAATVEEAAMLGYKSEDQRIQARPRLRPACLCECVTEGSLMPWQDVEDVDLMRRHLETAKHRAEDAEKELKRLRVQLRDLREAHDDALGRIAQLEEQLVHASK
jgi:hypothetical protein